MSVSPKGNMITTMSDFNSRIRKETRNSEPSVGKAGAISLLIAG